MATHYINNSFFFRNQKLNQQLVSSRRNGKLKCGNKAWPDYIGVLTRASAICFIYHFILIIIIVIIILIIIIIANIVLDKLEKNKTERKMRIIL